mgnify:CR=1 FL=1
MTTAERNTFEIAGRPIGPGHPPYVVAELSANHNGDLGRALAVVEMAKDAGADAVKLQTYTADTMTIDHDSPEFRISGGLWDGRSLHELYEEAHTPWDWHEAIFARGRELGITVFSAPFDATAVDLLESLDAPAYKIASGDVTHLPLLRHVAGFGKPIVLSTGGATLEEVETAVDTIRQARTDTPIAILHCVSQYPAEPGEANLACMAGLRTRFACPTGYSDHTVGIATCLAAAALGAEVIEKHFTLDRALPGPDHKASVEPGEPVPAKVVTWPVSISIFRILWVPRSVTYRKVPFVTKPLGRSNDALVPIPSVDPAVPLPAKVVTSPVAITTLRIL